MGGVATTIPVTRGFDRFLLAARSHNYPVLIRWIGLLPNDRYGWIAAIRKATKNPPPLTPPSGAARTLRS